jgi:predicted AAA+ superfamily ATPase
MLVGPRQSGKSTLAQALVAKLGDARYVSLDRGLNLTAARDDPAAFIAGDARTLVIDEVQRVPDLLLAIKASVDEDRRPGRFVLTGSADVLSLPRVADTLAGRIEVLRLVKSPKLVLTDAGLLAHLLGGGDLIERSFGAVLENFVLMEIVKQASFADVRPPLFHYRTSEGVEVDVVIESDGGRVFGVEVKAAATLTSRDSRGLKALAASLGDDFGAGAILHAGSESVQLAERIWALPVSALWAGERS